MNTNATTAVYKTNQSATTYIARGCVNVVPRRHRKLGSCWSVAPLSFFLEWNHSWFQAELLSQYV